MTIPRTTLFYALTLAVLFAFWFWAGQASPVPGPEPSPGLSLQSVSYAPFEKDQSPFDFATGLTISPERIDADLALLSRRFTGIRTYSVAGLEAVPEYAARHGLQVLLGAWIGADPKLNQQEIEKLITLARKYPKVVRAVVVGNEALLRREITGEQLAGYIRQVKTALPGVPVTYADVWEFWLRNPEVAQACDFITIHILPYWEDKPVAIAEAMAHVKWVRAEVVRRIPGKEIVIGETGWPSQGRMRAGALPGLTNQARFIRGFVALAEKEGWQYNLIEAFDQPWKRIKEGAVGGYWGLYSAERADKGVLAGPVSRFPEWRSLLLVSAILALASFPLALRRPRRMGLARAAAFVAGVAGGAILLALQARQYYLIAVGGYEWLLAGLILALAAATWLVALAAIATGEKPAPAGLAQAMTALRGRIRPDAPTLAGLLRLGVVAWAMIEVLVLVLDARYRSFNSFVFVIPTLTYAWLLREQNGGLSEKLAAIWLAAGALFILGNETPLNWQADIWVALCLLFAWPLWRGSRGVSLKPLWPAALISLLCLAGFMALRQLVFVAERLVEVCAAGPDTLICQTRALIGKLMYQQVFARISFFTALFAMAVRSTWLDGLAIAASVAGLVFYNVNLAALAFVVTWLVLAWRKSTESAGHGG